MSLRALTLTEPWATLVAIRAKHWETRSRPTKIRGEVAIHAAKGWPHYCKGLVREAPFSDALALAGIRTDLLIDFRPGCILAVADLTECVSTSAGFAGNGFRPFAPASPELEFGNYSPGRWAYRLENVRRLAAPVPCRGALGWWQVPPAVEAEVRRQL